MKLPGLNHAQAFLNASALLLAFCVMWTLPANAQNKVHFGGSVTGLNHTPLSGVSITAQNEQTGETFTATSAADGTYSLDLPSGIYSFRFTARGHAPGDFHHVPVPHPEGAIPLEVNLPSIATAARPPELPTAHADGSSFPPAGDGRHDVSGRAFLADNEDEETGYGLYSYLLLPAAPRSDDERKRDIAVIQSFLQGLQDVAALEAAGAKKPDLNVTYMLLRQTQNAKVPASDWVLDNYDFARAKIVLAVFSRAGRDVAGGPYVVSSLVPMIHQTNLPDHYLWQDMSHVPDTLAASWESEFERRAAKKEFWASDTRNQVLLDFRGFIANAATGLPIVAESASDFKKMLGEWVSWK